MKRPLSAGFALLSLATSACSTIEGGPPRMREMIQNDARLANVKEAISAECLSLPALGAAADAAKRNDLTLAYMITVDEAYNKYESNLLNDNRLGNFLATITSLGLATSGAAAGGKTARVLSAANTGVIGEREAFNKEFLFNQTIPALQSQMRAERAKVREQIYTLMAKSAAEFPTCLALQKLADYEQAGTLVGAIVGLTQGASEAKKTNEAGAAQALEELQFDTGGLADALRTYLAPDDDALMGQRVKLVTGSALAAAGLAPPTGVTPGDYVSRITSSAKYAAEQRALALGILATETDAAARVALIDALKK